METTANSTLSIPSFDNYIEDRKYVKNVSPKTLAWLEDAWKPFGPAAPFHNPPAAPQTVKG